MGKSNKIIIIILSAYLRDMYTMFKVIMQLPFLKSFSAFSKINSHFLLTVIFYGILFVIENVTRMIVLKNTIL